MSQTIYPPGTQKVIALSDAPVSVRLSDGTGNVDVVPIDDSPENITSGRVTVGTTAVEVRPARSVKRRVTLVNAGAGVVFIGGSGVITTTGLRLATDIPIVLKTKAAIYAVASASTTLTFLEEYD